MKKLSSALCLIALVAAAAFALSSPLVASEPDPVGTFDDGPTIVPIGPGGGGGFDKACFAVYCDGNYAGLTCGQTVGDIIDGALLLCDSV